MIWDQFKLDGKVAIVTGAGRGIGQAYALGLAEAGATWSGAGKVRSAKAWQKTVADFAAALRMPVKVEVK